MITTTDMSTIQRYAANVTSENDIYEVTIPLMDNELDEYNECFSDKCLEQLSTMTLGTTVSQSIMGNDCPVIFDCMLITHTTRKTRYGTPYKELKARAFMLRNSNTEYLYNMINDGNAVASVNVKINRIVHICDGNINYHSADKIIYLNGIKLLIKSD